MNIIECEIAILNHHHRFKIIIFSVFIFFDKVPTVVYSFPCDIIPMNGHLVHICTDKDFGSQYISLILLCAMYMSKESRFAQDFKRKLDSLEWKENIW